jgi:hypothetical protein
VVGLPPELGRCVEAPSEVVKGKTVFTGAFSKSTCSALSKKHNGHYNWEGGLKKGQFSSNEITQVTLSTANRFTVTCSGETALGEFVTPRRVEGMSMKFSSCSSVLGQCTTAGQATGKIITKTLEGVIGVYKTGSKAAANKAGLELYPVHKTGPFAEFSCGLKEISVRGAVVLPILANKGVGPTLKMTGKASKGKQKAEGLVEEPKAQLEAAIGAEPYEPIGITMTMPLELEEPLELDTVA